MLEMEKEVIALKVLSTMHSVASRCGSFRLQAQITSLRGESEHFEMELKLREMLEEELEKELTDARLKNQVQPFFIAGLSGPNNAISGRIRFELLLRALPRHSYSTKTQFIASFVKELSEAVQSQEESLERFSERVTNDVAKNDEYTNGNCAYKDVYLLFLSKIQFRACGRSIPTSRAGNSVERAAESGC